MKQLWRRGPRDDDTQGAQDGASAQDDARVPYAPRHAKAINMYLTPENISVTAGEDTSDEDDADEDDADDRAQRSVVSSDAVT